MADVIFERFIRWMTHQPMAKADGTATLHFESVIRPTIQNAAQAAPYTAAYVLAGGHDPNLTADRVLTAGTGVTITDGGAKGNLTISASTAADYVTQFLFMGS